MRRSPIALTALFLGLLSGCGGRDEQASGPRARPAPRPEPTCLTGTERALGDDRVAYAAVVQIRAVAHRRPGRQPFAEFGPRNTNGHGTVFGVLGEVVDARCEPAWYRVQLPMRPNGVTGYVRARAVEIGLVRTRIVVDLSERRVSLYRDGRPVMHAEAAVGSQETPTPTGRFYVNQRLIADDASGAWGPGAIGISAFSSVLTNWTQGGPIAIHGTNAPWSLGRPVSNGCLRLDNAVLRRMFAATPAGTPVLIRA